MSFARVCVQPLVCEISHPDLRGFTGSLFVTGYTAAFALVIITGAFLHWKIVIGAPVLTSILGIFGLIWMKNSPVWLVQNGKDSDALIALRFYDRSECEAEKELADVKNMISNQNDDWRSKWALLLKWNFVKPVLFLSVINIGIEWSCFPLLAGFLVTIFKVIIIRLIM